MMIKCYRDYLIYKYNFISLLYWMTRKLTNDLKIFSILKEISTFSTFQKKWLRKGYAGYYYFIIINLF